MPFSLGDASVQNMQPFLDQLGQWDFWIEGVQLNASFAADFDLGLHFYETHVNGVRWCSRKVWGITLRWPCGLSYGTNAWEVASINVYDGSPFKADFSTVNPATPRFTVNVIPEPSTGWLLALCLAALALSRTAWRAGARRSATAA
jgi:hypothetical protein